MIPTLKNYPNNWKKYYLSLPQNGWLCDIPDEYLNDRFNVYGLDESCKYLNQCINVITGAEKLSNISEAKAEIMMKEELPKVYGLIHARYILSPDGIAQMEAKYKAHCFGFCPRFKCKKEPLLPYGMSGSLHKSRVKGFCPICRKLYVPRPVVELDGGYFGPNISHFIIDDLDLIGKHNEYEKYTLTAFGFDVYNPRKESDED